MPVDITAKTETASLDAAAPSAADVMTGDGCPVDFIRRPTAPTGASTAGLIAEQGGLGEIGRRIIAGHDRAERGAEEWVEGSLEMAAALAEGRDRFKSDIAFGDWLTGQGHNLASKNDRAALINLGRDIPTARKVLEETESRSYRLIWDKAKDRFPNAGKLKRAKPGAPPTKSSTAADEIAEQQLRNVERNADFGVDPANLAAREASAKRIRALLEQSGGDDHEIETAVKSVTEAGPTVPIAGELSLGQHPPKGAKGEPASKLDPKTWNAFSVNKRTKFLKAIDPATLFEAMPESWQPAARAWLQSAPARFERGALGDARVRAADTANLDVPDFLQRVAKGPMRH